MSVNCETESIFSFGGDDPSFAIPAKDTEDPDKYDRAIRGCFENLAKLPANQDSLALRMIDRFTRAKNFTVRDLSILFLGMQSLDPKFDKASYVKELFKLCVLDGNNSGAMILYELHLMDKHFVDEGSILHFVVQFGKPELIVSLMERGADPNSRNSKGETPLHLAVAQQNEAAAKALLEHSTAEMHATDHMGATPLHVAAENEDPSMIELLHRLGSNLHVKDRKGNTPLHYASAAKKEKSVSTLVSLGAKAKQKNADGLKPGEKAQRHPDHYPSYAVSHANSIADFRMRSYEGNINSQMCAWIHESFDSMPVRQASLQAPIKKAFEECSAIAAKVNKDPIAKISKPPSDADLISRIQKGELVILPAKIINEDSNHAVYLVFCNGFYGVCNRGDRIRNKKDTIQLFPIDSKKFTQKYLKDIYALADKAPQRALYEIYEGLPGVLKDPAADGQRFADAAAIEAALAPDLQKVGNCSFANAKTALLLGSALYLMKENQKSVVEACELSKQFKKDWSLHFRLWALDKYLAHIVHDKNLLDVLEALTEIVIIDDKIEDHYLIDTAWKITKKHLLRSGENIQELLKSYPYVQKRFGSQFKTN